MSTLDLQSQTKMFWIILILNISYIYVAKIVFLIRVLSQTGVTDADRCAGL